jgi:hypothetical protein
MEAKHGQRSGGSQEASAARAGVPDTGATHEAAARRKKTYTAPVFTDYGPIGKLTQSGSFTGTDAMSRMLLSCL